MRIVTALGGNAILRQGSAGTVADQREALRTACAQLAELSALGHELVVTHGNGPQVGRLLVQQRRAELEVAPMPLDVLDAQTQGSIGYLLVQELTAALRERGQGAPVAALLTQVLVDEDDPAFSSPSKPVGPHYTETELEFRGERRADDPQLPQPRDGEHVIDGEVYRRVEGGTWRRVVPSPPPLDVVESGVVRTLLDAGVLPVCCGGGGCPASWDGRRLRGVEAVVDKDRTSALLARLVGADALLILTDVDAVRRDFGTPQEERIAELSVADARRLLHEGAFPPGSMGPKVEAAAAAAEHGATAVITSLDHAADALAGRAGTRVTR